MRAAVLGTGIMGAAMARSLAREGHDVTVWNRTSARAEEVLGERVTAAGSVAEAVADADVVLTTLHDTGAVLAVTDELAAALAPEGVWLQVSTVGPAGIARVAAAALAGGVSDRLLDAPVLGTRKPAEDGTLVVLLAGPEPARAAAGPALDAVGSRTLVVGDEVGAASALKLACNSFVAMLNAGISQAMALTESLGLDPTLFLQAVDGGPLDSPYVHVKGAAVASRTWQPVAFSLEGARKDIALMVDAAGESGLPDDLLRALLAVYARAGERVHGAESDMASVRTAFDS